MLSVQLSCKHWSRVFAAVAPLQVAAMTQQTVSRMKQQLPAAAPADKDVASCMLPPLQLAGDAAADGILGKRTR
jgi:hypothetical protein